ncbi:MAG: RNA polymerase sigma factor [Polyangiaceae bacterium]
MSNPDRSWKPPRPISALRLVGSGEPEQLDDAGLVRALVAREEWAATLAWNRFGSMVYGVLDRALGSAAESEDLTQEVFWHVFAAIRTLRDPNALRSFIYSSAIRMLRSYLRAKRVRRFFLLSDSGSVPERACQAPDTEGRDLLDHFYAKLDALGANDRTAFVLRHIEGLSLDEIASVTGASLATVKRRIRRAAQQIDRMISADPDFAEYRAERKAADDA